MHIYASYHVIMTNNNTTSLNIVKFNCQGIKSNLNYIEFFLANFECNILFICQAFQRMKI